MPVSERRKEAYPWSQNLRTMKEWLSGEVFWKFELFGILVTEVRKYLKRSHTFFPEQCCNQQLEKRFLLSYFENIPRKLNFLLRLLPATPCCTGAYRRLHRQWAKRSGWHEPPQVMVPARALLVYGPGGPSSLLLGPRGPLLQYTSPWFGPWVQGCHWRIIPLLWKMPCTWGGVKSLFPLKERKLASLALMFAIRPLPYHVGSLSVHGKSHAVVTSSTLHNETTRPWSQVTSSWKCFKLFMHLKPHFNTELLFSLKLFKLTSFTGGKKSLHALSSLDFPIFISKLAHYHFLCHTQSGLIELSAIWSP